MNAKLNVTRFSNEDVIATSACEMIGKTHYHTTGASTYDRDLNQTYVPGDLLVYLGEGNFVPVEGTEQFSLTLPGNVFVPVGRYYYYDGQTYVPCEVQAHGR